MEEAGKQAPTGSQELLALPEDIQTLIFRLLDTNSVSSISRTCKATQDAVWKVQTAIEWNAPAMAPLNKAAGLRVLWLNLHRSRLGAAEHIEPAIRSQIRDLRLFLSKPKLRQATEVTSIDAKDLILFPKLERLSIASNVTIHNSKQISALTTLRELTLIGRKQTLIIPGLNQLTNLRALRIAGCIGHRDSHGLIFSGEQMPPIETLRNLVELDVSDIPCLFSDEWIKDLPDLRKLTLADNQLNYSIISEPTSVRETVLGISRTFFDRNVGNYAAVNAFFVPSSFIFKQARQVPDWVIPEQSLTLLGLCSYFGLVDLVQDLMTLYNCDPKVKGFFGLSPLHAICCLPEKSKAPATDVDALIKTLVKAGAELNEPARDDGDTPLHFAAQFSPISTVNSLLEVGADVHARNSYGDNPLMKCLLASRPVEFVKLLLDKGSSINKVNFAGNSALLEAITINDPEAVGHILALDIDLTIQNNRGFNALHYLCCNTELFEKHHQVVLDKLPVDTRSKRGWTPLGIAAALGLPKIAAKLMSRGADNNVLISEIGMTPALLAVARPAKARATLYELREALFHKVDHTVKGLGGWTMMHYATFESGESATHTLLQIGADAYAPSDSGITPLMLDCAGTGPVGVLRQILETRQSPNARTSVGGYTALHFVAVTNGQSQVNTLLEAGADPNILDDDGLSPLDYVILNKSSVDSSSYLARKMKSLGPRPQFGLSPLFLALMTNAGAYVTQLVADGASVNEPSTFASVNPGLLSSEDRKCLPLLEGQWYPIHAAAATGNLQHINYLLEEGADPTIYAGTRKYTTLQLLALSFGFMRNDPAMMIHNAPPEIWTHFIQQCQDQVNQPIEETKYTPLLLAILAGAPHSFITALVQNRADPSMVAADGHNAFSLASLKTVRLPPEVYEAAKVPLVPELPIPRLPTIMLSLPPRIANLRQALASEVVIQNLEDAFCLRPPQTFHVPSELVVAFQNASVERNTAVPAPNPFGSTTTAPAADWNLFLQPAFGAGGTPFGGGGQGQLPNLDAPLFTL